MSQGFVFNSKEYFEVNKNNCHQQGCLSLIVECSGSLKQGLITVLLGAEHKEKQLFIFCVAFMPSLVLIFSNSVEMVTLIGGV